MSNDHETAGIGDSSGEVSGPTPGYTTIVHRTVTDETESVSVAVVEALAEAKGVSPLDIEEPLYDAVDPDALDALFEADKNALTDGRVVFTTAGYEVTVTTHDEVYVRAVD